MGKVTVAGKQLPPRPTEIYLAAGTSVRVAKDSLLELQVIGSKRGTPLVTIGPNEDVPNYRLPAPSASRLPSGNEKPKEGYQSAALNRDMAAGDCSATREAVLITPSCGSVIPKWVDIRWTPGKVGEFISLTFAIGSDTLSRSAAAERGMLSQDLYVKFLEDHQQERDSAQIKILVKQTNSKTQELTLMLLGDTKEKELLAAEKQAESLNLMDELTQKAELRSNLGLYREAYAFYAQLLAAQPGNLTAERKLADMACMAFGRSAYLQHIQKFSDAEKGQIPCRQ